MPAENIIGFDKENNKMFDGVSSHISTDSEHRNDAEIL
jgi:hypothetical protein